MAKKKIALLTGGGDCPGLNAVIQSITRRLLHYDYRVIGLLEGWAGLMNKNFIPLDYSDVSGILHLGGTIIKTSRTNILKDQESIDTAFENFKELGLDGLVTIGGEGTLTVASKMQERGMPIVGAPKTIDNDIGETDFTFGFNTAVEIATEAIDRLHTTAESHQRVMVLEVMGRHAGWIACYSGIAGGADIIITPEKERSLAEILEIVHSRRKRGKTFSIIVVAEGASINIAGKSMSISKAKKDPFGRPLLGGIGKFLADTIEKETGIESRFTVLGHVQRGGTPSAHDRVLAVRYGYYAAELVHQEKWGMMAALVGNRIQEVSLKKATKKLKTVNAELLELLDACEG